VNLANQVLRILILGYFAALFALAGWVAFSVLAAAAANPDCVERACRRYEQVGNWSAAFEGEVLFAASMGFTGVIVGGVLVFAMPWAAWLWVLKQRAPGSGPSVTKVK
jgi:hypothetical protein